MTKESEYFSYMFTTPGIYSIELAVYNVGGLLMDNTTVSVINREWGQAWQGVWLGRVCGHE